MSSGTTFNVPRGYKTKVKKILAAYGRDLPAQIDRLHASRATAAKEICAIWDPALDLYDRCLLVSHQLGASFNDRHRAEAVKRNDHMFEALARLHSQACRLTSEVATTLAAGYPDGAMARSRTMHELAVSAHFISEHDRETAERFLQHEVHERVRLMEGYDIQAAKFGVEGTDAEELAELKAERERLKAEHGSGFLSDYGWASKAIDPGNPKLTTNFQQLEEATQLSGARSHYQVAGKYIHVGALASGAHITVGEDRDRYEIGPSYSGLAQPAIAVVSGLLQVTFAYLRLGPDQYSDDTTIAPVLALAVLISQAQEEFARIERVADAEVESTPKDEQA